MKQRTRNLFCIMLLFQCFESNSMEYNDQYNNTDDKGQEEITNYPINNYQELQSQSQEAVLFCDLLNNLENLHELACRLANQAISESAQASFFPSFTCNFDHAKKEYIRLYGEYTNQNQFTKEIGHKDMAGILYSLEEHWISTIQSLKKMLLDSSNKDHKNLLFTIIQLRAPFYINQQIKSTLREAKGAFTTQS